jgi:hypothetical protein
MGTLFLSPPEIPRNEFVANHRVCGMFDAKRRENMGIGVRDVGLRVAQLLRTLTWNLGRGGEIQRLGHFQCWEVNVVFGVHDYLMSELFGFLGANISVLNMAVNTVELVAMVGAYFQQRSTSRTWPAEYKELFNR